MLKLDMLSLVNYLYIYWGSPWLPYFQKVMMLHVWQKNPKTFRPTNIEYTPNVCRDLQGLCRGFLQYLQGKSCNIYRFSLQFLQSVNIAGKICKYYRIFPADIAENPCRVPINPCKHLECTYRCGNYSREETI